MIKYTRITLPVEPSATRPGRDGGIRMKSRWIVRILALLSALALCLPAAIAEEIGEVDLYDPSIYIEEGELMPEPEPETGDGGASGTGAEPQE